VIHTDLAGTAQSRWGISRLSQGCDAVTAHRPLLWHRFVCCVSMKQQGQTVNLASIHHMLSTRSRDHHCRVVSASALASMARQQLLHHRCRRCRRARLRDNFHAKAYHYALVRSKRPAMPDVSAIIMMSRVTAIARWGRSQTMKLCIARNVQRIASANSNACTRCVKFASCCCAPASCSVS
jgi:hypothetical protein